MSKQEFDIPSFIPLTASVMTGLDNTSGELARHQLVQHALQEAYEQGLKEGVTQHFGPPCEKHEKVAAWLAPPPREGQTANCFGCYLEGLKFATRRQVLEEFAPVNLPPDD